MARCYTVLLAIGGAGGHGRLGDGGSSNADPIFLKVEGGHLAQSLLTVSLCAILGFWTRDGRPLTAPWFTISVYAGITIPGPYLQGVRCNRWVGHRKMFL